MRTIADLPERQLEAHERISKDRTLSRAERTATWPSTPPKRAREPNG